MSDLINGLLGLGDAREERREAESFYRGDASEVFFSPVIKRALGTEASAFLINYARIPVTARLSRMKINSVTTPSPGATARLDDVWADNLLDQEAHDLHEAALVAGETYAIVWPSADGESVDVFHNTADTTRVYYSTENPRVKSYAVKAWVEDSGHLRVNLYYADRLERWVSRSNKPDATPEDDDFVGYVGDGLESVIENPYGVVPVFHFRTQRPNGRPVHKDAFGPQRMCNKLVVAHASTVDIASFPQRYALENPTKAAGVSQASPDDWGNGADDDNTFYKDTDSGGRIGLESGAAALWRLAGVQSVGQFAVATPEVFTNPLEVYVRAAATATQTPIHSFNIGAMPSGEALRVAEAPLVKSVEDLELSFGATWRELFEFVLDILDIDERVTVTWAPAASYDDEDAWKVVAAKAAAGVPMKQALIEHGYTPEQVEEFMSQLPIQPVVVTEDETPAA